MPEPGCGWRLSTPRTIAPLGRIAVLLDGAGGTFPRHRLAEPVAELLRLVARGPFVTRTTTKEALFARDDEDDDATPCPVA